MKITQSPVSQLRAWAPGAFWIVEDAHLQVEAESSVTKIRILSGHLHWTENKGQEEAFE